MKTTAMISGLGFYVPPNTLTNADLERMVDTSDEWITTRTGIKERHISAPDQTASDLAYEASRAALDNAGLSPQDLTHIFVPTVTADYNTPSAACLLGKKLGISGQPAMDINAACSGFLYGLQMARAMVALEPEAKVLVAPVEVLSSRVNWKDRNTCVLFGDGSGAAIVEASNGETRGRGHAGFILDIHLAADGALGKLLTIGGGTMGRYTPEDPVGEDFFLQMQGPEIFKNAVRKMEAMARKVLTRNGLDVEDLALVIPHQANLRIINAVTERLGVPPGKVFTNVQRYGNTSAASVPIALTEARAEGRLKEGDTVLLVTFGGGFTWGGALLRF